MELSKISEELGQQIEKLVEFLGQDGLLAA